jgi:hypothetical protein
MRRRDLLAADEIDGGGDGAGVGSAEVESPARGTVSKP